MADLSKMNLNKIMNRARKNAETSKANNPSSDKKERRPQYSSSGDFRNYDRRGSGWGAHPQDRRPREERFKQTDEAVRNLGGEFYNPYTFIPFPDKSPERHEPSFLTVDENTTEKRYTGVLNLTVETVSPLLSMDSENKKVEGKHFKYKALKIGNDVIVPATSVRGSLRTLMTILSGGTLGHMDKNMWLCQGRDLSMNVLGKNGAKKTELAEVVEPGDSFHDGKILRGVTRMISLGALNDLFSKNGKNLEKCRPQSGDRVKYYYTDELLSKLSTAYSDETPWKIKLSGRRIAHNLTEAVGADGGLAFPEVDQDLVKKLAAKANISLRDERGYPVLDELWVDSPTEMTSMTKNSPDRKHGRYFLKFNRNNDRFELNTYGQEAIFKKDDSTLENVCAEKWGDYVGQNANGVHPSLFSGDLVWLELSEDRSAQSLQWARWGRGGNASSRLRDVLPQSLVPDSMNADNKVDTVTDLFGMVSDKEVENGLSFASRIRCHNLVFENAAVSGLDESIQLAPMGQPHPGCIAFYRKGNVLNGYKVYRNAKDGEKPWLYSVQGIFDVQGFRMDEEKFAQSQQVKTVDLLKAGQQGRLKISFRALSEAELSLLLTACHVDWKLGGGKPLGLGHCRVCVESAIDETGESIDLTAIAPLDGIAKRVELYNKSQEPVENMRYPRAVEINRNRSVSRSGLQWFMRHASPKKKGYRQELPSIVDEDQHLRGYDYKNGLTKKDPPEPFNPREGGFHPHGPNTSPNANSRQQGRESRNKGWGR